MIAAPAVLTTSRLVLREPRCADAARIADYAGDFEVARMTARIPYPYGKSDAEHWLAAVETEGGAFAIELGGEFIGCCGLAMLDERTAEIGYWIGRPWWGRGFATEAVGALVTQAFRTPGLHLLRAYRFADNPASGRVLEKTGFRPVGLPTEHWCEARRALVAAISYECRRPGLAERARKWLGELAS